MVGVKCKKLSTKIAWGKNGEMGDSISKQDVEKTSENEMLKTEFWMWNNFVTYRHMWHMSIIFLK